MIGGFDFASMTAAEGVGQGAHSFICLRYWPDD